MAGFLRLKKPSDLFPPREEAVPSEGISVAPVCENDGALQSLDPQVNSGVETCKLCLEVYPIGLEFHRHLFKHMGLTIALTLQDANLKCDICGKSFPNITTLAKHKGVDHTQALDTYRHLMESLEKFPCLQETQGTLADSFECNLCALPHLTTIQLLEHITTEHYAGYISSHVKKIRYFMLTPDILCPYSECRKPVESFKELIAHVGVDHMKVLENYLKPIKGSFAFLVLDCLYHTMLTEFKCSIHPSMCRESFMSKTELNIHICESHFPTELGKKFASNSKPIDNSNFRKCNICCKNYTLLEGAIHFGMGHRYLEAMMNEFDNARGNVRKNSSTSMKEAVVNVASSSSTSNHVIRALQVIKKPTENAPSREEIENDSALWSVSCPKCNHKVHFVDYNPQVSERLATHYFQRHRDIHNTTYSLIKDHECLLCSRSFKSSRLTVAHFQFRHMDVLVNFLLASLPEQNLSKHLNMGQVKTRTNSTLDLYSKYLGYAKQKLASPNKLDAKHIHSFLESSKSTLKLDENRLVSLLQLISDCHVPLANGDRLISAPIFFWLTRSVKTKARVANCDGQQESRLCRAGEPTINPSLHRSLDENSPDGTLTKWDNLENPLTCQRCRMDFPGFASLVAHVKNSKHDGAVLGCKFCDKFSFRVTGTPVVEAHLSAHWFSSEHLHNRFLKLFQQKKAIKSMKTNKGLWCEMCSGEIDFSGGHIKSQEHTQRHAILLLWVEFCDLRQICPVTCEIREVEFFLKVTFPKTRSNKQNKFDFFFMQVLVVCSNLHLNVGDQCLFATYEIEKLSRNLYSSGIDSQLPNFICFLCLMFENNIQKFLDHLNSEDHKFVCSQAIQHSFLKCEPCNSMMPSTTSFCLHLFTSKHLECTWHYNNTPDLFISSKPEETLNFCSLCSKQVNVDDNEHVSSKDHQTRVRCAEKYLLYCNEQGLQPAEIGIMEIHNYIEETFRRTPKCRFAEADVVLEVLNALHKPINGSKVKMVSKITNVFKTCRAATNFLWQVVFKENIYDILYEDQLNKVLMCPECYMVCPHATGMVFHAIICHQIKTANLFIMKEFPPVEELLQCPTCKKNLRSSLSFALHFDMHHLEKAINCKTCKKNYDSPALFYSKDGCGLNRTLSKSDKNLIIDEIKRFVTRSECKEKGIVETSPSESNESSTHYLRLLVSSNRRSKFYPNSELRLSVSRIGRNDPRPQPSVLPPNVGVGKRKEPETTSPQRDRNLKAKRSCFSSPPQSPTLLFGGYNTKKAGFCLDCENCQVEGCDHLGHRSRKVFKDILSHSTSHSHENIQVLSDCALSKSRVVVSDLMNCEEFQERTRSELNRIKKTNCNCTYLGCKC